MNYKLVLSIILHLSFFLVLLVISGIVQINLAEAAIYDGWIAEHETVNINGEEFTANSDEYRTILLLKSTSSVLVLDKNQTKSYNDLLFQYVERKIYLKSNPSMEVNVSEDGEIPIQLSNALGKFHLIVDNYESGVQIERSVNNQDVLLGNSVFVNVKLTNIRDTVLSNVEYEEIINPSFHKKGNLIAGSIEEESNNLSKEWTNAAGLAGAITGTNDDKKIYWKGNLKKNETIILKYELQLATIPTSRKAYLNNSKVSFTDNSVAIQKTSEPIEINVFSPLEIYFETENNESIDTGKKTGVMLALKNTHPDETIKLTSFEVNLGESEVSSVSPLLSQKTEIKKSKSNYASTDIQKDTLNTQKDNISEKVSTILTFAGELKPNEEIKLPFKISYKLSGNKEVLFSAKYLFMNVTNSELFKKEWFVNFTPLMPIIEIAGESSLNAGALGTLPDLQDNETNAESAINYNFSSGETQTFKFFINNKNSMSFYNVSGFIDFGFYQENFTREEILPNWKSVGALINRKLPVLAEDKTFMIRFHGAYKVSDSQEFSFDTERSMTILKKQNYTQPFRIIHYPFNYSDDIIEIYVGVMDLQHSLDWLEIGTDYGISNNGINDFTSYGDDNTDKKQSKDIKFSKVQLIKGMKGQLFIGQRIRYNITNALGNKIENISLATKVSYKDDDDTYTTYLNTNDPLSTYITIVDSMKSIGEKNMKNINLTDDSEGSANVDNEGEGNADSNGNDDNAGSLISFSPKTIVLMIILIIVLIILAIVLSGYTNISIFARLKDKLHVLIDKINALIGKVNALRNKVYRTKKENSDDNNYLRDKQPEHKHSEKPKKLPEAPKPAHDYTKLKQYISECRKQGFNEEEIKKALVKTKWMKDVVEEFLEQ